MDLDSLLVQLRAGLGVPGATKVSPPVTETDIRRWAIACYWPEIPPREFWDAAYAAATRWGGIIAPAEFNPFAWPVDQRDATWRGLPTGPSGATVAGGTDTEYFAPIRPGDVLTSVMTPVDLTERRGRSGRLLFYVNETRLTNQRGELVRISRSTQIIS